MSELQNLIDQALEMKPNLGVRQGSRKFKSGRYGKKIIFFHSIKNGRNLLPCEGELEAAHCLWMEFDNSIEKYVLQPFEVDTGNRRYTPDALVIHSDGHITFRQVKPQSALESDSVKSMLIDVENFFHNHGFEHITLTENDFFTMPEHRNREVLYAGLKISVMDEQIAYAKHILQSGISGDFRDFHNLFEKHNLPLQLTDHLIFEGYLTFNKRMPLCAQTRLEVA